MNTNYYPPHNPTDETKLAAMVETLRAGGSLRPIAAGGDVALTGSHRIAAVRQAWAHWNAGAEGWEDSPEPTIEAVQVSNDDYRAACARLEIDHHDETECNAFAAALYAVTSDEDLRAALADQRHDFADLA